MTKTIATLIALTLFASTASAEETKKPRKPSVFHADACQMVALKGATGSSDAGFAEGPVKRDTAMLCETKSSARILKDWRILAYGDGDMFVVGR